MRAHNFNDRTGEIRTMNNGLKAKIVAYRNKDDIDICFENGLIVNKKTYRAFCRGSVYSPFVFDIKGNYTQVTNPNTQPNSVFLIDTEDIPKLQGHSWYLQKSGRNKNFYVYADKIALHRFIIGAKNEQVVDHINGNTLDNRKCNLRICTQQENSFNAVKQKNNTSGYKGVTKKTARKKFYAGICVRGKRIHLGCFDTAEQAALVYNEAAKKYYGEFAKLNVVGN